MYSEKEKKIFSISRAVIDLHGFFIVTTKNVVLDNPKILVELLTIRELTAYDNYSEKTVRDKLDIEDSVLSTKVIQVVNYPDVIISLNYTPAGIISYIAEAIILKSQIYIENPVPTYDAVASHVTFLEKMAAIVSYYTNTPYSEVIEWPVSQIFKRYAICQSAFATQIEPLRESE